MPWGQFGGHASRYAISACGNNSLLNLDERQWFSAQLVKSPIDGLQVPVCCRQGCFPGMGLSPQIASAATEDHEKNNGVSIRWIRVKILSR